MAAVRRQLIEDARAASADDGDRCRMLWVLDQWSAPDGYHSKRSRFWSALNDVMPHLITWVSVGASFL